MIRPASRLRHAATIAVLVSVVTEAGLAQEQAPGRPSAPETSGGIVGARKDFESVKAARDPALQSKPDAPRISTPEWHGLPSPSVSGPASTKKKPAAETKSKNWLVDAMQKPATTSSRDDRPGSDRERDASRERAREGPWRLREPDVADANASSRPDAASTAAPQRDERNRKAVGIDANPLTRFLGDWMTPQDYALLKPGLEATGMIPSTLNGGVGWGSGAVGAATGGIAPNDTLFGLGETAAPRSTVAAPARENPFLQSLTPPAPPPVAAPSRPLSAPPVPAIQSAPPPLSPPAGPAQIPEFAKPSDDAKYFKQLKRF